MGEDDPTTLVNTLVYLFGKYVSFRSAWRRTQRAPFFTIEVIEGDLVERIKSRLLRKRIMQEHYSIANSRLPRVP